MIRTDVNLLGQAIQKCFKIKYTKQMKYTFVSSATAGETIFPRYAHECLLSFQIRLVSRLALFHAT